MKISTLVTSFRKPATLCRSIQSVAAQSHPPVEIIVLEDASGDESASLVRSLLPSFPTLRLFEYAEKSSDWMTALLKHGVSLTRGDFVHFPGADDWLCPGFYEACARSHSAGVILGNTIAVNAANQPISQAHQLLTPGLHQQDAELRAWLSGNNTPGGTACLLSREVATWLRDTGADRLGPWFDSVCYPAACWPFGLWYLPETFGMFTSIDTNYGGAKRPAAQRARERPGAEAWFAEPEVRGRLPEDVWERLLDRVRP